MTPTAPSLTQISRSPKARLFTISMGLFIAGLAVVAALLPSSLRAQILTDITIVAIPPRLGEEGTLTISPGEKIQTSVKVRNVSSQALTIQSEAIDFIIDEDGETPIPIEEEVESRWSLASWLLLAPTQQTLQPNQLGQVHVVIEVPADALPGGHYAMIAHQPGVEPVGRSVSLESEASASRVTQRVGSLLYVKVDGPIHEEAFIRDLNFPNFTEYGPVPFSFSIDNQSDIHMRPQVGVEIYNLFGRKIDTIDVQSKNIFPLMSRNFEGQWDQVWGTGYYTAKVIMSYGTQGQVIVNQTHFWLMPITLIMGVVIIFLTVLAVGIAVRRHLIHRQQIEQRRIEQLEKKLAEFEDQKNPPVVE